MEEFLDGLGNPVWDIFSITEADYIADTVILDQGSLTWLWITDQQ